ncbi:MAG: hypothetical protein FWE76_08150, partial [Symbiobacteriaceae bacterium]|nr:hypothetical protein [Symbiobacteriaceae bacterium]
PWVEELRYVILCGMPRQLTLTPESLQAVPVETKSYQIYELRDPHALYPLQTLSGPVSREESHVLQYQLRYLASTPDMLLSCTIELAETIPGEGVEFCLSEVNAEMEETIIFLSNTWRTITHRLQAPQGAAEGDSLPFFDLRLTLRDLAGTPLRFRLLSYSIN